MTKTLHITIGVYLERARLCDVMAVESRAFCWHAWLQPSGEYLGNFRTKREAEEYAKNERVKR